MKSRAISGWLALGVLSSFILLDIWLVHLALDTADQELEVSFLDVGQGDATLIELPEGTQILVDGGSYRSLGGPLSDALPFYDRSIDVVVATHADGDHIGGLITVLEEYQVKQMIIPAQSSRTNTYKSFQAAVADEVASGGQVQTLFRGDIVEFGDSASMQGLFPVTDHVPADINSSSLVFIFSYGNTKWLFSGDSPQAIERYLTARDGARLDVDVLQVGHHGSYTSSYKPFVAAASPAFSVISAAADNPYGHPDDEVMGRLISTGSEVLCTCEDGSVVFSSDGSEIARVK